MSPLVILIIAVVILSIIAVVLWATPNKPTKVTKPENNLSMPAKQLVKEYNALPLESRPFPDIISIVEALDERTSLDADARNTHFNSNGYYYHDRYSFSWNAHSSYEGRINHKTCKFKEYHQLHDAIAEVATSVEKKNRALHESNTAHAVEDVMALTERLRQEAGLNNDFAAEFKKLER